MHWIWQNLRGNDNEARIEGRPAEIAQLGERLDRGVRIVKTVPPIRIVRDADSQGTLTDNQLAPGTTGLLLSSRLRKLLGDVGVTNIDYYPVTIENPSDGSRTDDYALGNLIGRVTCFDLEKSALQMDPTLGEVEFIDSLVLKPIGLDGLQMFRAAEHAQVIVVHPAVREACLSAGITGVQFVLPEDFSL